MAEQILPDDLRYVYSPEELAAITALADTTIIEVTTPSTAIPLKTTVAELKEFILSGAGSGDMLASTYDPTSVEGDAFDMDNMNDGTTNKLVSATEKSNWDAKLDYLQVIFEYSGETLTSTKTVAEILAAITANKQIIAYYSGLAAFITENITVGGDIISFTFLGDLSTLTITGDGSGETDSWTLIEENIEKTSNKVSTWSETPTDTNYPSEKLVKDGLDDKQDALTFGIANTNSVKIDAADVADNDYAKFTENGLEGKSYSEVLTDIGAEPLLPTTPDNPNAKFLNGNKSWAEITIPQYGTPDFTTLQDYINIGSAGRITGGTLTDDGVGGVNYSEISGMIKATDSDTGVMTSFKIAAGNIPSASLTDNALNYIYIDNDTTPGTPVVAATTDRSSINLNNQFIFGNLWKDGTHIEAVSGGATLTNFERNTNERLAYRGIEHAYGAEIGSTGTRNLTSTDGISYFGNTKILTDAKNTATGDTFSSYYQNGSGGWTKVTGQTQVDNIYYDNGTGTLAGLGVGRYGVHWVYICGSGDIYLVYGRGSYTLAQAQAAVVSTPPTYLSSFALLAAKIMVVKSSNTLTITSAYKTLFPQNSSGDHAGLANLDYASSGHTGFQPTLTFGIANTNAVKIDEASISDNDYAKFTANGLEGRTYAEVLSDIGGQAALGFTPENVANKETSALDTSTSKYPCNNVVNTALGTKVTANAGITAATKTKITYDAKGLVTGGADATTADIADSTNKRYCTDAEKTVISNTSNTNTGDQDATDFDIKDLTDSTSLRSTWSGKQDALTFGIANTNALKVDDASAADNEYAKLTDNGIEGRSYTEVKQDLDLEIGTDVQAYDAGLTDIAGLAVTDGNIIVGNGTNWVAESGATARTSLGVTIGTDVAAQTHATQHAVGGSDSVFPTDPNADKYLKYNNASNAIEWADVATPQLVYPLSDGAYSGFTIAGTLYETVAFGEAVYYDGTKWRKLSCLVTLIDGWAGICVQAGNANAATTILLYGTIRADSAYNFTAGYRLYSSYTAGQILSQISTAVPTTANVIPYILGSALDANTAFIHPQFVEAQKMTGGGEATDPSTIQNVIRNNQWLVTLEAAGTTRSIAIAQTTECPITHLDLQNTTGSDITVTFTPPSGKTIVKNYDSLVVAAGGHKLIRYWLVGTLLYIVDEDMTAGGTDSDEKVKYDASDPTAGYIVDKFVAGTGISLAEGTGANENKLVITSTGSGSGDMLASTYDPTSVAGDAFDMDNMNEGDTNLILTSSERTKISNSLTKFTLTYYQAKPATCSTGETCFDTSDGKIYTATATDTWGSGVAASTSVIYIWQQRLYQYISGTTLSPLAKNRKLRKSPTVTSNAFVWNCSGESSKSFVSNNANTTCTVTPVSGDEDTEHSLLFTNSDASASHTISFAAASGFTLKMLATTLTIPASGFVELSVELYGTVCYIKYSIN